MKYWFEVPPEREELMKAILPSIEHQLEVKFVPFKTANKSIYRRGFVGPRGEGFGHMVWRYNLSRNRTEVSYSHRCKESIQFHNDWNAHWDNANGVWWTVKHCCVGTWLNEHGYTKVEDLT